MRQVKALFIGTSNAGVTYWRFINYINAAFRMKAGHFHIPWYEQGSTETQPWEVDIEDPNYKNRIIGELWEKGKQAEVIVFQMIHTEPALRLFKAMKDAFPNTPLVVEQDDQILSTPTYNPADACYSPGSIYRELAIEQMRLADAMVVSTPYLKEVYSEFCENIIVAPNSLDFRKWDNLKHKRNKDIIRIGWAGGASHDEDLRIIEPVMHRILAKYPQVKFCFVHGIPQFLKGIERVENIRDFVRIDRYPQYIASRAIDINLAPLVDNAFNRGKSNLRWLEFAGLKIPTVASKVGHFAQTITQEVDGMLCETEQDWFDSLSFLVENEKARKNMGKAANAKARKDFNVDVNVFSYAKALLDIADKGQVVKLPQAVEA